eukprot:m.34108 g.34108  ORF g.34108 m.34108 type:complete len:53 (+) comp7282_c0_seq1:175-333(+)
MVDRVNDLVWTGTTYVSAAAEEQSLWPNAQFWNNLTSYNIVSPVFFSRTPCH